MTSPDGHNEYSKVIWKHSHGAWIFFSSVFALREGGETSVPGMLMWTTMWPPFPLWLWHPHNGKSGWTFSVVVVAGSCRLWDISRKRSSFSCQAQSLLWIVLFLYQFKICDAHTAKLSLTGCLCPCIDVSGPPHYLSRHSQYKSPARAV